MGFDWVRFLEERGIDYVETGPNVASGHVNIQCPFCGSSDPSQHMGLNLDNAAYACWRDSSHRGKSPARVIRALLRCSREEAEKIVGGGYTPSTYDEMRKKLEGSVDRTPTVQVEPVEMPESFREVSPAGRRARFYKYLKSRGFGKPSAVAKRYNLRCCMSGDFAYRLIFPFYRNGDLIGWTGRAVVKAELRYLAHPSSHAIRQTVFNEPVLDRGGEVLAVVEGPVDAMKLDYYGSPYGVRAVSVNTTSLGEGQVARVMAAAPRFRRVVVMFDRGAVSLASAQASRLPGATPSVLPYGVDDPGSLSKSGVRSVAARLAGV